MKHPRYIIIAEPNGAGKTTLAREFLPKEKVIHFVNADLLAAGLFAAEARSRGLQCQAVVSG